MLELKLQYFGYLMTGADSLEKTLMLGKIEGRDYSLDPYVAIDAARILKSNCFQS